MLERVGAREMAAMLHGASLEIIAHEPLLTELDGIGGDGDHGTTMRRAAASLKELAGHPATSVTALLAQTGNLFLINDGGASGGLLGAFFLGVATGCEGDQDLDAPALAAAFASGLAALRRYSKAKTGDKTMLDALEPAVSALLAAAARAETVELALAAAAQAAVEGAAGTKAMRARFGRAQHLGERTLGHQDPGATTIACLFSGFVKGLKPRNPD